MFARVRDFIVKIFTKLYLVYKVNYFKFLYGEKIDLHKKISFRRGFKLIVDGEGKISIGKGCFFNYNTSISCLGKVEIGEYCLVGENVKMYDHNHRFSDRTKRIDDQGFKVGTIKIGNNCWIGSNVTILNNVTIGDNVVIGANCLIYKSVPSNTIVKSKSEVILQERKSSPSLEVVNYQS